MLTQRDLSNISQKIGQVIDAKVPIIIEKQLQLIKKDIQKIKKDLKLVTNYFDQNYLNQDIRITHLEKHVGISSSHLA